MKLAGTEYTLIKKSFDIFISGCIRNCPGCFNPEAQSFDFGETLYLPDLLEKIQANKNIISNIRLMGGDPLCQPEEEIKSLSLTLQLQFPNIKLWLFTGCEQEDLPSWCYEVFDVIKVGPYIQGLYEQGYELASKNQKFIKKGVDY